MPAKHQYSARLSLPLAAFLLASCGPTSAEDAFRDNVRQICIFWGGTLFQWSSSDIVVESACVKGCIKGLSEAEAIGPACEEAYSDLTSCFGDLSESEGHGWWDNRRVGDAENYDYACEDATTPFLELCPGVWYND